ncbi:MAG: hypothetical protein ACREFY_18055, partial [Acetobacteraceae bacterium]
VVPAKPGHRRREPGECFLFKHALHRYPQSTRAWNPGVADLAVVLRSAAAQSAAAEVTKRLQYERFGAVA